MDLEGIEATEENIFIAAACDEKGIAFLKGESPLNVRKTNECENMTCEVNKGETNTMANASGNYTVVVDGQKFNVTVAEGGADIQVAPAAPAQTEAAPAASAPAGGTEVPAVVNGNVWKILVKEGDKVTADQTIMILEAMKMEIDIKAPCDGTVQKITAAPNDAVDEGQTLAIIYSTNNTVKNCIINDTFHEYHFCKCIR